MSRLFPAAMPEWGRNLLRMLAIGFVCGVVGYGVGQMLAGVFPGADPDLSGLRWADVVAGLLAAALLIACVATWLRTFSRAGLGKTLKLEGPAGDDEVRDARTQAGVIGLSAVILPLPMIFSALAVSPWVGMAVVAALLVLHTLLNLRLYRSVDELFRRTVVEAGAVTFWLGQGLLFLWAAAERLAVAPPITAWDVYVVLMGIYLFVSMIVTMRRGLA